MTPDHLFPGSGSLLGAKLGCPGIPAPDLRTQCAAMLYAFQMADALLRADAARTILIVGAEAHAGLMPWRDWDILEGKSDRKPTPEAWDRATRHRGWAIIFGDGAGAVVVEKATDGAGIIATDLHSDGRYASQLCVPAGFRGRPWTGDASPDAESWLIQMEGREVFKFAVTRLPRSVKAVCDKAKVALTDIDWFIAHQANQRINEAVAEKLKLPVDKFPSNIDRFGNTSAATIPILIDEMRRDGRLREGQLVCLMALGAGFHWGSVLMRV
jgi:3-oxoacyl-[acyl-carrier-protein] synthase-3